ncbi:hypothetical protein BX666DRAFT_1206366 [Dichotomocladium elegans]|nr:hypothetical protein BX666DRAFT_1206366 [Dichotomocladium elegans]
MASRPILSIFARRHAAFTTVVRASVSRNEQCRLFQTSAMAQSNSTQREKGERLTSKFIDQVKKEQNLNAKEPTSVIQVDALPVTTTVEDIRKLAREALPDGDKAIREVVFVRNEYFEFDGRCVISMKSAEDAQRVLEYGNRRLIGGNMIRMSHINKLSDKIRSAVLYSVSDAQSAAGRSVMITGMPKLTEPQHLLGYLRSKNFFPADGSVDNIIKLKTRDQATVSKFLVKFESESEAWRAVRKFHNIEYLLAKHDTAFKLNASVVY